MKKLVLFDTEYTAWEGSFENNWSRSGESKEIIQIAALKVTIREKVCEKIEDMNLYVKPSLNNILSDYIKNLTGITQSTIDAQGVTFSHAMSEFYRFCEDGKLSCVSWGNDYDVIAENCRLGRIDIMPRKENFIDLKAIFVAFDEGYRKICSGELHRRTDSELPGVSHNAVHDVYSLMTWLNHVVKNGVATEKAAVNQLFSIL